MTSPLTRDQIENLRRLRNYYRRHFFDPKFITEHAQRHWYDHIYSKQAATQCMHMIWYAGEVIGFFSLKRLPNSRGFTVLEVGNLLIHPAYSGRGFMEEALRYAVGQSHCILVAHVKDDNHASLRLFEKLGFWKSKGENGKAISRRVRSKAGMASKIHQRKSASV